MSNAKAALLALAEQNIAELNAENAKLRADLETQREVAAHNTSRNAREYNRVRDENDRLRELAKKLKACNSSCGRCIELYGICEHETELRELRVEVNV